MLNEPEEQMIFGKNIEKTIKLQEMMVSMPHVSG